MKSAKSVWELLAKMPKNNTKAGKNTAKTEITRLGGVVYTKTTLSGPDGGGFVWDAGWTDE